jgi:hypothetical protein
MPLLRSNPNVIGCRLALLLLLLQCCGCAQVHAVAVECPPRPELPAPLAKAPPQEGTFLACLQELSQGQTSGPNCAILHAWAN